MSVSITTRQTKSGSRYTVRYRRGGRFYPVEHGGSFRTQKEAHARRNLVAWELADRGGWARASLPLDVYSHVMPLDEVPTESYSALLVWSRCGPEDEQGDVSPASARTAR